MKLEGKVALVTGAGRGLGRAYALHLAKLGADVVVNDIDLNSAAEFGEDLTADTVMDEVTALGRKALGIEADAGDRTAVNDMFEQTLAEFGRVDILVANAGGMAGDRTMSHASHVPEDDFRANLDRNLMGTVFCCQAASVPMKRQRSGRIVTVASIAGLRGLQDGYYASYGTAKAAIINYTRYLAAELAPFGINVNCLAPAYINTRRLATWNAWDTEEGLRPVLSQIPMGRLGEVEDCAKVVEFFVTDLSDYVTGQCLSVCGGAVSFR
jgi:NAD(P)-dependent dehydrogenase (short-subunit alcohol dehydrogenase family)